MEQRLPLMADVKLEMPLPSCTVIPVVGSEMANESTRSGRDYHSTKAKVIIVVEERV